MKFRCALIFAGLALSAPALSASDIVSDFMCPCPDLCGKALEVCECSDAAGYIKEIRDLAASGLSVQAIHDRLVEKYGPTVLASPPARGMGLLAYVLPPLVILVGIAIAVLLVRKWARASSPKVQVTAADIHQAEETLKKWKS